ncbi:hypothetical protein [Brevundimonas sp. R86498]|uniref:hypothetical protein n=1 Tax=Brevundimonas sp. R86498 TaxID=3093845 RepID=UPI0037C9966E
MEPMQSFVIVMGAVGTIFAAFAFYAESRVRHFTKLAEQERAQGAFGADPALEPSHVTADRVKLTHPD